jgi:hypothetical protein
MDTRTGQIYDSREEAEAAGVPERYLVTGTREALKELQTRLRPLPKRGSKRLFKSFTSDPKDA